MGQIPVRGFRLPPHSLISPSCRGADRVALAQPQVDDPEDTDLQEHEKVWNGKSKFHCQQGTTSLSKIQNNLCLQMLIARAWL